MSKLTRTKPQVRKEPSKASVLKKWHGQFKKIFPIQKQSPYQQQNEVCINNTSTKSAGAEPRSEQQPPLHLETHAGAGTASFQSEIQEQSSCPLIDHEPEVASDLIPAAAPKEDTLAQGRASIVGFSKSIEQPLSSEDSYQAIIDQLNELGKKTLYDEDLNRNSAPQRYQQNVARPAIAMVDLIAQQKATEERHVHVGPTTPIVLLHNPNAWLKRDDRKQIKLSSCPPALHQPSNSIDSDQTLAEPLGQCPESPSPALAEFAYDIDQYRKPNSARQDLTQRTETKYEDEIAALKTELFVANGIIQSRENDLVNQQEDHEAEIESMREELAAKTQCLEQRDRELRYANSRKNALEKSVKKARAAEKNAKEAERNAKESEQGAQALVRMARDSAEEAQKEKMKLQEEVNDKTELISNLQAMVQKWQAQSDELTTVNDEQAKLLQEAEIRADERKITVVELQGDKTELERQAKELRENLDFARGENKTLETDLKSVELAANASIAMVLNYQAALEDENPARIAHFDDLIQKKDAAFHKLEDDASECVAALEMEKMMRKIDQEHSAGKIQGLRKELNQLLKEFEEIISSRESFQQENEKVFQLLKGKVSKDEAFEALYKYNEVIQNDNSLLISMVTDRTNTILLATQDMASLREEIVKLEGESKANTEKERQLQGQISSLKIEKENLEWTVEMKSEESKQEKDQFEGQIQGKAREIQRLLREGAPAGMQRLVRSRDRDIARINADLQRVNYYYGQLLNQMNETREDFCHVVNYGQIYDWTSEQMRYRLFLAERQVIQLKKQLGK